MSARPASADFFGLGALTELALAAIARRDLLAECSEQLIAETAGLLRACRWDDDALVVEQFAVLDKVYRHAKACAVEIRASLPAPAAREDAPGAPEGLVDASAPTGGPADG